MKMQLTVFALVAASFANIYITQPVLPVLQKEFDVDLVRVSFTISAVILGIAVSNLPFGALSDRLNIRPIIGWGGMAVALAGIVCAITHNVWVLIAARFVQGLFIPALTTCLAAYLAKTMPPAQLNVVMGSYVAATVLGGLGGRLLGGFIHPPLHWRYAFVSAAALITAATVLAVRVLPPRSYPIHAAATQTAGYRSLMKRRELWPIYGGAAGGFAIFSSIFNYLPFRLAAPPFGFSTEAITMLYLVYIVGIFTGPLAGRLSNRLGSGHTLLLGTAVLGFSLLTASVPYTAAVVVGLLGMCAGFFTIHASSVGALNRKLTSGQGRANALYILFYYLGGWTGITTAGFAYKSYGWCGVVAMDVALLTLPFYAGLQERRKRDHSSESFLESIP
jgi:YNFM family putative membrane transporter